jgi:hypothetical protein
MALLALIASLIALTAPGQPAPTVTCDLDPHIGAGAAEVGHVSLAPWVCATVARGWRADDVSLTIAVQAVLHEGVHLRQFAAGAPESEHAAECGALRQLANGLAMLGVHRRRRDRLVWFDRSNIRFEAPPYGGAC